LRTERGSVANVSRADCIVTEIETLQSSAHSQHPKDTVGRCRRKMGKKRSRDEEDCVVDRQPNTMQPSLIKNKIKRSMVHAKLKQEKKVDKKKRIKSRDAAEKRALELGEEPPKPKVPRTIENTREADETVCQPDDEEIMLLMNLVHISVVYKRQKFLSHPHASGPLEETNLSRSCCLSFQMHITTSEEPMN